MNKHAHELLPDVKKSVDRTTKEVASLGDRFAAFDGVRKDILDLRLTMDGMRPGVERVGT